MNLEDYSVSLSPKQFEIEVQAILDTLGADLGAFDSTHREVISGVDGEYEIDVTARFNALNVDFLVLVECKHQRNPVKREIIQILFDKVRSVGAQKGILFSTAKFQSGAIKYAETHGIALVHLVDGKSCWRTKSLSPKVGLPPGVETPSCVGWRVTLREEQYEHFTLVTKQIPDNLRSFIFDS
jgi:restriction system protein